MKEENREQLFSVMRSCKLNILFQHFPEETDVELVMEFLNAAGKEGVQVYLLTGDPKWGTDEKGTQLIRQVQRAGELKTLTGKNSCLAGVMADVEPHLTNEWKADPQDVMSNYVRAMENTYTEAKIQDMEFLVCIPYYYDSEELYPELEELVHRGCDGIAVMNYYKGKEKKHVEAEAELADRYGKSVMTIYELQPPGNYGLEENNTYYREGLAGIKENWEKLEEWNGKLTYGIHHYEALLEVLNRE